MNCLTDTEVVKLYGCKFCGKRCIVLCDVQTLPLRCIDSLDMMNKRAGWQMIKVIEKSSLKSGEEIVI